MKILILSCNTGEGHTAAAKAVCEAFTTKNEDATVLDLFLLNSQRASNILAGTNLIVIKKPVVFGTIYKLADFLDKHLKHKSPVYYANRFNAERLKKYIEENNYNVIISTHMFASEVLTALKLHNKLLVPTINVVTDYTCIPFYGETELDYTVIPHKDLTEEFVAGGIKRESILPFGIPVNQAFSQKRNRKWMKKKVCEQLHIDNGQDRPLFLIMTGGTGYGNIENQIEEIFLNGDANIIVCCGYNEVLKNNLKSKFNTTDYMRSRVVILGYTNQVSIYMDACDAVFTKPGGLSTTEAAVKNIPIIHTDPIPGCETINAAFYASRGMSITGSDLKQLVRAAYDIYKDDNLKQQMFEAQNKEINKHAAEDIYKFVCKNLG